MFNWFNNLGSLGFRVVITNFNQRHPRIWVLVPCLTKYHPAAVSR